MFFIIETTVDNGVAEVVEPIQTRETREEAESSYYAILAQASISQHEIHGAVVLNEDGMPMMYKSFTHKKDD